MIGEATDGWQARRAELQDNPKAACFAELVLRFFG